MDSEFKPGEYCSIQIFELSLLQNNPRRVFVLHLMNMQRAVFLLVAAISCSLKGQHFGSIANGHYSGVHATKINPALTAYSAYNWHINLIGGWGNVNNNFLSLHLPYSAYRLRNNSMADQYKTENGNPRFDTGWLRAHINGFNKHAAAGAMIYGPSFVVKIKKFRVGLVSEATGLARISGMSENLAYAFYKELDSARNAFRYFRWNASDNINLHKTTLSANTWMAIGAHASYSIPLEWKKELLLGTTIKKVWGFGGAYLQHGDMVVHRVNNDSVTLNRTNIRYAEYNNNGRGTGMDLGVAYVYHKPEYRQPGGYKGSHTQYQYKFGFSLLDLGKIRYRDAYYATIVNNSPQGWNIDNEQDKFNNQNSASGVVNTVFNELPNFRSGNRDENIGLPTRMALTADYQVKPHWFVNGTVVQSLRGRYSKHARHQSYAMVAPRYEREFYEFGLPVFLEYDYRSLRVGANVRLGPLYFGTNSLIPFFRAKGMRDADFFIGITISDIPGKWKDRWIKDHENKRTVKDDCEKM